ncbi:hypothetical protein [Roseovarius sp.]|uniref:hypothetical protein n=1 Tax=Roseovarius sp. TaxID=1486281 RepID=UPI0026024BA7|nr:hypothetical protein [Roseovarius sp.]
MRATANTPDPTTARLQADLAAQWLALIGFSAYPGAPSFGPGMCHYSAILDPDGSDEARLESCRAMLACVRRKITIEEYAGHAQYIRDRPVDPYGKHWRVTRHGAELWMIAHLLDMAIAGLKAET